MTDLAHEQYTPEQIAEAARVIEGSFDPATGRHPIEIFNAINRTAVRPVVEIAVFSPDNQEVLLTKREDDDPYYANTWHLPGVIVVPADIGGKYENAYDNAAVRALDEIKGTHINGLHPLSVKWLTHDPRISLRGGEAAMIYGGMLMDEEPTVGEMFDVEHLPEPIHEHHPSLILSAQKAMVIAPAMNSWPHRI
ncbi:MAG TPA: hypothetical protein VD947_04500 [Patescibacteria group bacterium]|nr:hypothetical protein [Patescibacteria group bacterium]